MREKLQTLPLTVLREFAKDKHIKNITVMRKADLIEAIIKADEEEKAAKDEQEKTVKAEPEQPIKNVQPVKNEHEHANINHNDGYVPRNRQNVNNDNVQDRPEKQEMADGILEVMQEGYGFIRCENFLPGDNDVYVSPPQIRRFNLKTGDIIR